MPPPKTDTSENAPSGTGSETYQVLNDEVIANWRIILPPDKINDLVAAHIAESKVQIRQLHEAGKTGALDDIRGLAHDLKSVCGNIGMDRVRHLAAELEQTCRAGHDQDARQALPQIEQEIAAAAAALIALYPAAAPTATRDKGQES